MRSLIYQFLAPVAVVAICAGLAAFTGVWIIVIVGGIAGIVLAAVFAQRALARLAQLQLITSRQFAPARSGEIVNWPEEDGDEIDEALHHAEAFMSSASERWTAESERVRHLNHVLDRMRDAVIQVDAHGVVTYGNLAASTMFGGRNPAGRSFIRVVRDHRMDAVVRRCLDTGEDEQYTFDLPGDPRIMNAIIVRIAQYPKEALVVLRDVTELNRLQTVRRDFVANVSHELRTPLSTIKILADTILDLQPEDEEVQRFVGKIDDEIDSMTMLVQDLLDISQLEKGPESLRYGAANPAAIAQSVVERMGPRAEKAGVTLSTTADASVGEIHADGRRLEHALLNLATNAIDHTPSGGAVRIDVRATDAETTFLVSDNGSGIADADLERIWERFFKTDRSRAEPGTGLGLAIVKHVALAHGGNVDVNSTLGMGSTFEITIPNSEVNASVRATA
ncbi:MAG: HAMP domain-containing histidine kinase [Thermomicrobiales bacterium]|nr:HAMP domain-containing histidine kinase [Thermomicrobiales bacterium]